MSDRKNREEYGHDAMSFANEKVSGIDATFDFEAMATNVQAKQKRHCFDLPWPPSANHYWGRRKGGGTYVASAGIAYREDVAMLLEGKRKIEGEVTVAFIAYPPDKRKRDIDNIEKAMYDALTLAGIYDDDCKIKTGFKVMDTQRETDTEGWVKVCIYAKDATPREFAHLRMFLESEYVDG